MNSPVPSLREMAAFRLQFVFDQERHHLGQPHRLLFGVSETSDLFTFHQRLTVRALDVAKRAGCVTDRAIGLPAARNDPINLIEFGSSARSHIGPWPPG